MSILWKKLPFPEFDYIELTDLLATYSQPRRMINYLLKRQYITRVKKGLYVLGEKNPFYRPFSIFRLANLIYGPSYISLESALSFYGLIPEASYHVTSITSKRKKAFETPVGTFSYYYLDSTRYPLGTTISSDQAGRGILIASPEKSVIDTLWRQRADLDDMSVREFFFEYLRFDEEALESLDVCRLLVLIEQFNFLPQTRDILLKFFFEKEG
jgi:hypothetical protein